jgi:hypothetical protein
MLVFTFILLKVMIVSRGEPATARALIEGAAPVAVVMDAFLTIAPIAIAFLFVRLGELNFRSKERSAKATMVSIAWMFVTYLAFAIVPLVSLIGAVVGTLMGAWMDRRNRRKGDYSGTRLPLSNSWTGTILGTLIVFLFTLINSGLWVPTENVNLKGGRQTVAYVVSSRDGWVTLFDKKERRVIRERAENIESREICGGRELLMNKTVTQLGPMARRRPDYPRCRA